MNEIEIFKDGNLSIEVPVSADGDTVWLNRNQMAELFQRDVKTIGKHINNALKEELDSSTVANFATVQNEGERNVHRDIDYYNLDMIISVGYRVKSARGIAFRRWANNILKQYILKGYAVNEKRLNALGKTIELQSRIIAGTVGIEETGVLQAVNEYANALTLLDEYDHQVLKKPEGNKPIYRITYEECRTMIDKMVFGKKSSVFGVEKEPGKVEGIIAAVYQNVFGGDVYPTLEEKAANLLYFMIKDHPFTDGCKRIAASLFLEFLSRNEALYINGMKRISDSALVAITLMIAESRPEEKDIMTTLVMNFLK